IEGLPFCIAGLERTAHHFPAHKRKAEELIPVVKEKQALCWIAVKFVLSVANGFLQHFFCKIKLNEARGTFIQFPLHLHGSHEQRSVSGLFLRFWQFFDETEQAGLPKILFFVSGCIYWQGALLRGVKGAEAGAQPGFSSSIGKV
ncbi:MAG: hypothetical protein UDQ58_04190, partial [Desulfovibrio sp.]|nr:hypothetical protein [Desulfovibrio sp.]